MSSEVNRWSGWRGVCLVAITYIYFLIFAQFAFLKRLATLGIADTHLKVVMAAMATGGILFSLLASKPLLRFSPQLRLRAGLIACATAALLSLLSFGLVASVGVSFLIGCGVGLLTVTLVSHLDLWIGTEHRLLKVGLGTGIGYFVCNVPLLFTAAPRLQALTAAVLCLLGIVAASRGNQHTDTAEATTPETNVPFIFVLISFVALIWLDSAAFYIIQNTPSLKAGTWQGTLHLWVDGTLHLAAAIASAWLLRRRGLSLVLSLAVLSLACACLLLFDPSRVLLASAFYPIGVSLYSVALVAYPSLLIPASSPSERARRTGIIYAIAGWVGSAMGIGMAQNLGHIPTIFIFATCAAVLGPQLPRIFAAHRREILTVTGGMLAAFGVGKALEHTGLTDSTQIARGRKVYISEGCINCHSQYIRPNTPDVVLWGPTQTLDELRAERPPLIGNRRQGPDLSEVGGRRSPLWLMAHQHNPRQLSYGSFMPSYSYLFHNGDTRGDDLVAYLSSLRGTGTAQHLAQERAWQPTASSTKRASASEGADLFVKECATCHTAEGTTRQTWQTDFKRLPPNLTSDPWLHLRPSDPPNRLSQIIKFGIPGTDMPGHEYLSDQDIASIVLWLKSTMHSQGEIKYFEAEKSP
jgi:cbb3-type cytochrome c oxidase subunit II